MRFSKSPWLFIYVSLLSLTQGALGCASATMGLLSPSIASHIKIIPVADAWLAMSVACDMSITYVFTFNFGTQFFRCSKFSSFPFLNLIVF